MRFKVPRISAGVFALILGLILVPWAGMSTREVEGASLQANLFFSPTTQTVIEGSTFQVSLFLDTKGQSISTMELFIKYPPQLMEIVSPSAGESLIQLWLQPPSYSNSEGAAHLVGLIPNGVVTESGLVTTMTFRAVSSGKAEVSILPGSQVLANDGLGSVVQASYGRANYTITPKPPAGVRVFSETHPFESSWYKDKNVVIGWDQDADVDGFSYSLDTEPSTIPDDLPEGKMTSAVFSDLSDGLHYFHIRASREGVWGQTTHFLVRVDTLAPAGFKPEVDALQGADFARHLISFLTTDSLSGIDHYEVGVIDKTESPKLSPVFVQAESPYQFSPDPSHDFRVIVRAVDKAGNVRDESLDIRATVYAGFADKARAFAEDYLFIVISGLLALLVGIFTLHYLIGHHVYSRLKALVHLFGHAAELEKIEQQLAAVKKSDHDR